MTPRKTSRSQNERCELTTDAKARAAANELEASVAPGFPDGLAKPALRALGRAGYRRLEELANVTEAEVQALHGMGPQAIKRLRQSLAERGLSFAD